MTEGLQARLLTLAWTLTLRRWRWLMGWAKERTVKRATRTKTKVEECISTRRQREQGGKEGRRRNGHKTSTDPFNLMYNPLMPLIGRASRASWHYRMVAPHGTPSDVRYSTPIVVVEGGRLATRLKDNGVGQSVFHFQNGEITSSSSTTTVTLSVSSSSSVAWNNQSASPLSTGISVSSPSPRPLHSPSLRPLHSPSPRPLHSPSPRPR